MQEIRIILSAWILLILQGCAIPVSSVETNDVPNVLTDTVVVFKLTVNDQTKSSVILEEHSLKDKTLNYIRTDRQKYLKSAESGYYILSFPKFSKENAYALYAIWGKDDLLLGYGCDTKTSIGIDIHENGLFYMGDIEMKSASPVVQFNVTDKMDDAKDFLSKKYSGIAPEDMSYHPMKMFKTGKCRRVRQTIYL